MIARTRKSDNLHSLLMQRNLSLNLHSRYGIPTLLVCHPKINKEQTVFKGECRFESLKRLEVPFLIIKITISSLVIGLKKSYFPLIRFPSCYRTVCYWIVCYWTVCHRTVQKANHIQRCSLKQPITFKVVTTCACACACFCVYAGNLRMFTPPLSAF